MRLNVTKPSVMGLLATALYLAFATSAYAHGVAEGDQGYIEQTSGPQIMTFLYLGAKHMVTGNYQLLDSLSHVAWVVRQAVTLAPVFLRHTTMAEFPP